MLDAYSCAPEAKKLGENKFIGAVSKTEEHLNHLLKTISDVEKVFTPVLIPENPSEKKEGVARCKGSSSFEEFIIATNDRLFTFCKILENMCSRSSV